MMLISFFAAILFTCLYRVMGADLGADPATRTPHGINGHLTLIRNQSRTAQQINAYLAVAGEAAFRLTYRLFPSQACLNLFKVALSLCDRQDRHNRPFLFRNAPGIHNQLAFKDGFAPAADT